MKLYQTVKTAEEVWVLWDSAEVLRSMYITYLVESATNLFGDYMGISGHISSNDGRINE
jgi:hypothetical protein